jgi:hypothetical protein
MKLEDVTGKSLLAIEVFGLSIQALKSHLHFILSWSAYILAHSKCSNLQLTWPINIYWFCGRYGKWLYNFAKVVDMRIHIRKKHFSEDQFQLVLLYFYWLFPLAMRVYPGINVVLIVFNGVLYEVHAHSFTVCYCRLGWISNISVSDYT